MLANIQFGIFCLHFSSLKTLRLKYDFNFPCLCMDVKLSYHSKGRTYIENV